MTLNDELNVELAKKKAEEIIIMKELDTSKQKFIDYIKENLNDDVADIAKTYNKPVRYHKPLKLKLKEFFNKISKVLGL